MAKLNTKTKTQGGSPIKVSSGPKVTHEGAAAKALEKKGELFSLAVTNMVGEDTFYESGNTRDNRYVSLIHDVTAQDPDWVYKMLVWLRSEGNLRTAALVGAAEYVRVGGLRGRRLVDAVCQRADEPGEVLAYWVNNYGKQIPQPIKRGVADASKRLYDEYSVQKYDSTNRGFRFADVIQLTHPKPGTEKQAALFKYALDRRYQGSDATPSESLEMLRWSKSLDKMLSQFGVEKFLASHDPAGGLKDAGWTWERLSSYGAFTKKTWEAIIPTMGYMALLRNLRNFEQAGVRESIMNKVRERLADPDQVARSRQLPYRFYSAYRQVENNKTKAALETALEHSFQNIELPGSTLVLIDVSGSMQGMWNSRGSIAPADIASVMGVATAFGTNADIVAFATDSKPVSFRKGGSVLEKARSIPKMNREVGHGTLIGDAIRENYNGHDRVLVFTDMQSHDNANITAPLYIFDLSGYGRAPDLGSKVTMFAGWNDNFLKAIPLIERGRQANWPWE